MTECERIIEQGILPKSFFEPETICDFYVDENRKKVWAVEIDLLIEFDKICRKNGLKYFLMAGSLLGAVRHKGFIPWDDDMDVVMPREDYEKFLKLGKEIEHPYFLQTCYTDHGFYYAHAKIRNSNTAAIDYPFMYQGFNLGIFIDILPLDNFDPEKGKDTFATIDKLINENSVAMRLTHPNLSDRDIERVKNYKGKSPISTFELIDSLSKESNNTYTGFVSTLAATTYGIKRAVFPASCFENSISCEYNGVITLIPKGYHDILSIMYGDYMKYPKINERGQWHSNVRFFPDVAYNEVLKNMGIEKTSKNII